MKNLLKKRFCAGVLAMLAMGIFTFGLASCSNDDNDGTVNAKKMYVVTYESEQGTAPSAISVEENTVLTQNLLPSLAVDGISFLGWFDGETKIVAGEYKVTKNVTLRAKWGYKVSFETAGLVYKSSDSEKLSTNPSSVTVVGGTTFKQTDINAALANYSFMDGYTLAGWYFDSNFSNQFSDFTVNANKKLYAKFTKNGAVVSFYKITYKTLDKVPVEAQHCMGTITCSNYPTGVGITRGVSGKVFCGWFYDESFTKPVLWGDVITADTTFHAKWVNFSDLAATSASDTFAGADYASFAAKGVFYTRTNDKIPELGQRKYTRIDSFENNTNYFATGLLTFGKALLYSESLVNNLKIRTGSNSTKVDANGIQLDCGSDKTILNGEKVDLSRVRVFAMVTLTKAGTVTVNIKNASSNDCKTQNAKAYLVTADGTILDSKSVDNRKASDGSNIDINYTLSGKTGSGNVFVVFCRNGDGGGSFCVKNFTFEADASVLSSSISFSTAGLMRDINGLTAELSSVSLNSGTTFTQNHIDVAKSSFTVKEGYALEGWYFDADYTQPFSEFKVDGDKRLYAKFTKAGAAVPVYKISYKNTAVPYLDKISSGKVVKSDYFTVFGNPEKFFCGWFYDEACTKPVRLGDAVSADTTFHAKWVELNALSSSSSSASFTYEDYSSLTGANGVLYTRSAEKKSETGFYEFTKAGSLDKNTTYFFDSGVHKVSGALVWVPNFDNEVRVKTNSNNTFTNDYGIQLNPGSSSIFASNDASKVDMSLVRNFVMVTMSKRGTVKAYLKNYKSNNCTTMNAKAYLVNSDGTILDSVSLDNRGTADNIDYTLSAEVTGNVFVVTCRNGDNGGGVSVKSIGLEENIAAKITALTASGTVKGEGLYGVEMLRSVNLALKTLAAKDSNILVTLDLSGVEGLTNLEDSWDETPNYSFRGCTNLKEVMLPSSVKAIGGKAFLGCTALTSIAIPDGVTTIVRYAFTGCTALASITIPASLTSIGISAFSNCPVLTSATFADTESIWYSTSSSSFTGGNPIGAMSATDKSENAAKLSKNYDSSHLYNTKYSAK